MRTALVRSLALAALLLGCDPRIVLGERSVSGATGGSGQGGGLAPEPGPGGAGGRTPVEEPPRLVLWSDGGETGDFSVWEQGGTTQGGLYQWASGLAEVSTERARSGTHAIRCFIDTSASSPGNTSHGARLYRQTQPEAAYYGAWFWIGSSHEVADWWSIFLFNAQATPGQLVGTQSLWDLRLQAEGSGLRLHFFDHQSATGGPLMGERLVPIRRWFHVEAYLDDTGSDSTTLRFYVDGELLFETAELAKPGSARLFWVLGNGSSQLDPSPSVLFVDDATVATYRVGP